MSKQIFYAAQWTLFTLVIYFLGTSLLWHYAGYADIPAVQLTTTFQDTMDLKYVYYPSIDKNSVESGLLIRISVSFIMYMVAIASFIGWVLFSIFGGIGLASLPLDLLVDFKNRPKKIKLQEYTDKKKLVGEQAAVLLEAGARLILDKKT